MSFPGGFSSFFLHKHNGRGIVHAAHASTRRLNVRFVCSCSVVAFSSVEFCGLFGYSHLEWFLLRWFLLRLRRPFLWFCQLCLRLCLHRCLILIVFLPWQALGASVAPSVALSCTLPCVSQLPLFAQALVSQLATVPAVQGNQTFPGTPSLFVFF